VDEIRASLAADTAERDADIEHEVVAILIESEMVQREVMPFLVPVHRRRIENERKITFSRIGIGGGSKRSRFDFSVNCVFSCSRCRYVFRRPKCSYRKAKDSDLFRNCQANHVLFHWTQDNRQKSRIGGFADSCSCGLYL